MHHNIMLESPANIYFKQRQLHIATDSDHRFPIEDLNALVIGNKETKYLPIVWMPWRPMARR